jgi:hypothetical protein
MISQIRDINLDSLPRSRLLKSDQVAEILGTTVASLSVARCTGRVTPPFVQFGRTIRYRAGDLIDFIDAHTRRTT